MQTKVMKGAFFGLVLGALVLTGMGCRTTQTADTASDAPSAVPASYTEPAAPVEMPQPVEVTQPPPPVVTDAQLVARMQDALAHGTYADRMSALEATEQLLDRGHSKAKSAKVIDALLTTGARMLDDDANWTDTEKARRVYDLLKREPAQAVIDGLARKVMRKAHRRQLLYLGVKLGIDGSEKRLNSILRNHGDKAMAEDFLNSGSEQLHEGARLWGEDRGYYIATGDGSHRTGWGDF